MNTITLLANNTWQNTLPVISHPLSGESLYGYLLRLDFINNLSPGTILDMLKKHTTGKTSLNRPGLFLVGKIFDLKILSKLVALSYREITKLTLAPTIQHLFKSTNIHPSQIGYSTYFKICPICISEMKLPIIHSFKNINICLEHEIELQSRCTCNHKIVLFSPDATAYHCPNCNTHYSKLPKIAANKNSDEYKKESFLYSSYVELLEDQICLVNNNESLSEGLENRLQFLSYKNGLNGKTFSEIFGYDNLRTRNGHGLDNISLAKIIDMLYGLGHTPKEFRDLKVRVNLKQREISVSHNNFEKDSCPNIYCKNWGKIGIENIKHYGRQKYNNGEIVVEKYCNTCGTRFIGDNITQSYDYNPGVNYYILEAARNRIVKWQEALKTECQKMIDKRIPITLTNCFKEANIPIGKTYSSDRLGLIDILEKYTHEQIEDLDNWKHELNTKEINSFLRRVYKRKR